MEMKIRLMEELEEHMPDTTKFCLGYMKEGSLPNVGFAVRTILTQCTQPMLHVHIRKSCFGVIVERVTKIYLRIKGIRLVIQ